MDRVTGWGAKSVPPRRSEAGRFGEERTFGVAVSVVEASMSMLSVETSVGSRLDMEAAMLSMKVTLVVVVTRFVVGMYTRQPFWSEMSCA